MTRWYYLCFVFVLTACDSDVPCKAPEQLAIGMVADQVADICGKPKTINGRVGPWGDKQQWVYATWEHSYVYMSNGKVESWDYQGKIK